MTSLAVENADPETNFGDMRGIVVSAADFLEAGKRRIETRDFLDERRPSVTQEHSTTVAPVVEETAVQKLVIDEEYEKTINEKILQIKQRRERVRDEITKIKYLALEPPEAETLMEAAEDSSAEAASNQNLRDDDDRDTQIDISLDPTNVSSNSGDQDQEHSSADDAAKKFLSVPYGLRRKAQKSLPRGVHWQDLDFNSRMQAVNESASKRVNVIRNSGEPLGIKVSGGMVLSKVEPHSCSAEAGLEKYIGWEITHLNGVPISSTNEIARNSSTLMQFSLVEPAVIAGKTKRLGKCGKCGSWIAERFSFCVECGNPLRRKKRMRKKTNKPLLAASKEIESELIRAPPHLPHKANVKAVGVGNDNATEQRTLLALQRATYSDIIRKDVIAEYLKSITTQYEVISSPSSNHSSDRACRHGHGERRLWGKTSAIRNHPFETYLTELLTMSPDISSEITRLKELSKVLESGEIFAHLERYKLHLSIECDLIHRWLAGIARSKGATGDPRKKSSVKRKIVKEWLADVKKANPPPPPRPPPCRHIVIPKPIVIEKKPKTPILTKIETPLNEPLPVQDEVSRNGSAFSRASSSTMSASQFTSSKSLRRLSLIPDENFVAVVQG